MDLSASTRDMTAIKQIYRNASLKRDRHMYTLRKDGTALALLVANISDCGLNLSNLTNSITAIVLEPSTLSADYLQRALETVACLYEEEEVPVLVYPSQYAADNGLPVEKTYNLWIIAAQHADEFIEYMDNLLGRNRDRR